MSDTTKARETAEYAAINLILRMKEGGSTDLDTLKAADLLLSCGVRLRAIEKEERAREASVRDALEGPGLQEVLDTFGIKGGAAMSPVTEARIKMQNLALNKILDLREGDFLPGDVLRGFESILVCAKCLLDIERFEQGEAKKEGAKR